MNPERPQNWWRFTVAACRSAGALPLLLAVVLVLPEVSALRAQATSTGPTGGFTPGGREIFALNLAQETVGEFPRSLRQLLGSMEVVEKDGKRMLRASDRSEFLITLPERLPEHFTLEFDLITRADYNNDEIAFEGTPTLNRSTASAHVMWYQRTVTILGGREAGGGSATFKMPDDLAAEIEGQPAEIRVDVNGDNFKLYTNGRRILSLPDLKFVRGRVLRVFLGGHDTGLNAVHLSRLRIADAGASGAAVAQQQSAMLSTPASAANQASAGGPGALAITGLTVTAVPGGGTWVTWNPLPVAATYFVVRWNANDPVCCNTMSPPGVPLTRPAWQDSFLPVAGVYAYRVIATTASGTVSAETRFTYQGAAAPSPGAPPPPGVPAPTSPSIPVPTAPQAIASGPLYVPPPTSAPTPNPILVPTSPAAVASGPLLAPPPPTPTTTTTATGVPRDQRTVPTMDPALTGSPAPGTGGGSSSVPPPPAGQSGGGGAPAAATTGLFRVMLTGLVAARQTFDDPLSVDGLGDEVYGVAAVTKYNRQSGQLLASSFAQTRAYGDTGVLAPIPGRIQAGSAGPKGGIRANDQVPSDYDPSGANLPAPATEAFPLLAWEGSLTSGVDAVVIVPSLWSRNADPSPVLGYKLRWSTMNPAAVMNVPNLPQQYTATSPSVVLPPLNSTIGALPGITFGPGRDRPIGMSYATPPVTQYQERLVVLTWENLASVPVGGGVTMRIALVEPADIILGGNYTLYLRVERRQ